MIALHHILSPETPLYGGNGLLELKQICSISDGDTSNSIPNSASRRTPEPILMRPIISTRKGYPWIGFTLIFCCANPHF